MKTRTSLVASLALFLAVGCGSVSSGGDAGTDAAGGTAGAAGHAGSTGTAGSGGTAGAAGQAGSTGGSGHDGGAGASCNDLATQYASALGAARTCSPGAAHQCEQLVSSALSPCFSTCMTYVQDTGTLDGLKAAWTAAGCNNQGPIACPAIACLNPVMGNCLAGDAGGGTCSSGGVGPIGVTTN